MKRVKYFCGDGSKYFSFLYPFFILEMSLILNNNLFYGTRALTSFGITIYGQAEFDKFYSDKLDVEIYPQQSTR